MYLVSDENHLPFKIFHLLEALASYHQNHVYLDLCQFTRERESKGGEGGRQKGGGREGRSGKGRGRERGERPSERERQTEGQN